MLTVQTYDEAVTAYGGFASSQDFESPKEALLERTEADGNDSSEKTREPAPETIKDDNTLVNTESAEKFSDQGPVEPFERNIRITALLLRPESVQFLRLIIANIQSPQKNLALFDFIRESEESLQTFAQLVTENLISLEDRNLVITALAERVVHQLAGETSADQ